MTREYKDSDMVTLYLEEGEQTHSALALEEGKKVQITFTKACYDRDPKTREDLKPNAEKVWRGSEAEISSLKR